MKLLRADKIYDNGKYHAWTDLAFWKGKYFLGFRTGTMHASHDGTIEVIYSENTFHWFHCFNGIFCFGKDNADPKFLVTPEKLYLYFVIQHYNEIDGTYLRRVLCTWTTNGNTWSPPVAVLPDGYTNWRPKIYNGEFFMAPYHFDGKEQMKVDLFKSKDAIKWDKVSSFPKVSYICSETEISFDKKGRLFALVRQHNKTNDARMYVARPPYKKWEKYFDTGQLMHGPCSIWWNDELFIIGRYKGKEKIAPWDSGNRTGVFRLQSKKLKLEYILPLGGDCSYAGAVINEKNNLVVSYYSSMDYLSDPNTRYMRSSIYLAELS